MIKCKFASHIPEHLMYKATKELTKLSSENNLMGWNKISSLKNWFSFRLNLNYRILYSPNKICFIGHHDFYIKKIQFLRRQG